MESWIEVAPSSNGRTPDSGSGYLRSNRSGATRRGVATAWKTGVIGDTCGCISRSGGAPWDASESLKKKCPHRLARPRTSDSQSEDRGSNPRGDTKPQDTGHQRNLKQYREVKDDPASREELYMNCTRERRNGRVCMLAVQWLCKENAADPDLLALSDPGPRCPRTSAPLSVRWPKQENLNHEPWHKCGTIGKRSCTRHIPAFKAVVEIRSRRFMPLGNRREGRVAGSTAVGKAVPARLGRV